MPRVLNIPSYLSALSRRELAQAVLEFVKLSPEEQENTSQRLDKRALKSLLATALSQGSVDAKAVQRRIRNPAFKRKAAKHPKNPVQGESEKILGKLPGLTARQMAKATPPKIWENARHVKVNSLKRIQSRKTGRHAMVLTTTEPKHAHEEQPHKQRIDIVFPVGGTRDIFEKGVRLKTSCDCSYFMFYCERALAEYGAADILYSNGKWPRKTNPKGIPWTCKHMIAIFKRLRSSPIRRRFAKR